MRADRIRPKAREPGLWKLKVLFFALVTAFTGCMSLHGNDWAFSAAPGRHRGQVNAIVQKGDLILSAGEDGFLEIWNPAGFAGGAVSGGQAGERFQLSPYSIISLAGRPGKDEVCIVENDGMGLYHVSAWDFTMRRKIFTLQFRDPIGHISYSTGGNFIVAARAGRTGIVLIDSASGDVLRSPQALTGTVGLAVTGRSERNMMVYLASGAISYWDLETGTENNRFDAPANLSSPVLFGNSRYLAGVNSQGLTVIHAASGEILAANSFIPGDSLLSSSGDGFICLVQREESADLYRYTVDRGGRLVMLGYFTLSAAGMDRGDRFTAICAVDAGRSNGPAALGISNGSLAFAGLNGQTRLFTTQDQALITEAAVSDRTIAFLSGDGRTGFIPADYNMFSAGRRIDIERNEKSFNRITAFAPEHGGGGQFVFWQDQNTRTAPVIRSTNPEGDMLELSGVSFRSPVHSAGSFGGKIVFMDTTGNLSVVSPADEGKSRPFTYFSIGLMDAAFVDRDRLVIGRSAVSGNTPFLMINIDTGETVPLPYPAQAGVMVHRGASGGIYTAAITQPQAETAADGVPPAGATGGIVTSILQLNPANSAGSPRLVDFQGEDSQFSMAETPGGLAATIGGEGAAIYSAAGVTKLERTGGLPHKLFYGGSLLLCLDKDGAIAWNDPFSGKLLAVFRLYPNGWTLQTEQRTISGGLQVSLSDTAE